MASDGNFETGLPNLMPNDNSFVNLVIKAYNQHHMLALCPGRRLDTRYDVDFASSMLQKMVDLLEKNVVDPTLREWAMPSFTTTTATDLAHYGDPQAILLLWVHRFVLCCGIPKQTGRASLGSSRGLKAYGIQTIAWYHFLRPVISRFVAAFVAPTSPENIHFWQRIVHFHPMSSGPSYYSGWINTFSVFSTEGAWLGRRLNMATYGKSSRIGDVVLDGTLYHTVDRDRVALGSTVVDVQLNDNERIFDCAMVAGMIGMQVSSSDDLAFSSTGINDIVQPVPGWWMYTKK
ncbi:hypothetical protein DFH07DRAFT_765781 [Mycena maculata]|uniref:Uncharacterized protein n=1 Tax=Mycena maculata TaxID=230809 RepID=A0AAD7NX71_9AGAR|nr:hypothetical protein DFH07DRAFT_765781 [Mycena maculata]